VTATEEIDEDDFLGPDFGGRLGFVHVFGLCEYLSVYFGEVDRHTFVEGDAQDRVVTVTQEVNPTPVIELALEGTLT
jgi:hypothetical protein